MNKWPASREQTQKMKKRKRTKERGGGQEEQEKTKKEQKQSSNGNAHAAQQRVMQVLRRVLCLYAADSPEPPSLFGVVGNDRFPA